MNRYLSPIALLAGIATGFRSKKVEQMTPGKLRVTGDLTIRGTTKEVVLDVDGPTSPTKDPGAISA